MYTGRSLKRNSQKEILEYLSTVACATESEIQVNVWGYYRSRMRNIPNKKYADILRRALSSGKISRMRCAIRGKDTRKYWYYYIPKTK